MKTIIAFGMMLWTSLLAGAQTAEVAYRGRPQAAYVANAKALDAGTRAAAKPALPQLIAALRDEDLVVRMTVGLALGNFGKDAKPAIRALIEAGNDRVGDWVSVPLRDMRRAMAWALGEIGPEAKGALPALNEWGKFYRVKWYVIPAIAKIEGKPAPPTWR